MFLSPFSHSGALNSFLSLQTMNFVTVKGDFACRFAVVAGVLSLVMLEGLATNENFLV